MVGPTQHRDVDAVLMASSMGKRREISGGEAISMMCHRPGMEGSPKGSMGMIPAETLSSGGYGS